MSVSRNTKGGESASEGSWKGFSIANIGSGFFVSSNRE